MMKGMVFAERYKLEDFIGQGGMSLVYRALDVRTGHSVAVKILKSEYNSDKEFLERFQREAQAASLMSHHNLVNLLDVGVEGEYRYLVLEYVNGNTLKDIIRQKGRLNPQTAIQITIRILSALQHAHDNGIIHRDIKPQNVLIHADGHVKVADFGIARMTNAFTISKGDTVVGSVHYSSPEQASGSVVEGTSDLYSTGVVLYEMLTGRVPFVGDTPVSVAMQHIKDAPPPITDFAPETPPALVAVVMKAMQKDPRKRFRSAREMAEALMQAKEGKLDPALVQVEPPKQAVQQPAQSQRRPGDSTAHKPAPVRKAARRVVRSRKLIIKALVSVLAVAAVIGLLVWGVVDMLQRVSRSAIAPDVVGMDVEDAIAMTTRTGLNWQQKEVYHDTLAAGTVISQMPEAGTTMQKEDSLLVTVSLGRATTTMPDMTGLGYEEATVRLKDRGFGGILIIKTTSTEQVGMVLSQNPQPGAPYAAGQAVELTVSGGSTLVPDVLGQTLSGAEALLDESLLNLGQPLYAEVESPSQVGLVVAQTPASGTVAVLDAAVTLTIGVERQPYHGQLSFEVQPADKARALRVMQVTDGAENIEYEGSVAAGETAVSVPLTSAVGGEVLYRVYIDAELYLEQTILLQE